MKKGKYKVRIKDFDTDMTIHKQVITKEDDFKTLDEMLKKLK